MPARKAAAMSVPPEMLHHQTLSWPRRANCSVPHRCTSGGKGDPVLPRARIVFRPPILVRSSPPLRQLLKKAAPAPNQVIP